MFQRCLQISVTSTAALIVMSCSSAGYNDDPSAPVTLEWKDAVNLIYTGKVESAMQTHKGVVTLNTANGERFVTQTPKMDEILRVKKTCAALCRDMAIAME